MVLGLWEIGNTGVVSMEGYKAGGRGCKFSDKAFQPSEQVEERDYLTCLPLWPTLYARSFFRKSQIWGVISHPTYLRINLGNGEYVWAKLVRFAKKPAYSAKGNPKKE